MILISNMTFTLIAIVLGTLPKTTLAFSTSAATRQVVGSPSPCRAVLYSRNDVDDDDFDPFRQSPHSFGGTTADADYAGGSVETSATFGFLSIGEPPEQSSDGAAADGSAAADDDDDSAASAFDPLLSPHAYANGADAGPVVDDDDASAAVAAAAAAAVATPLDFDPLLSPHAYANGVDAGPVADDATHDDIITATATAATQKIGILLIDHGSRRAASNAHIHDVAKMYESRLNLLKNDTTDGGAMMGGSETTVVRAAHMEITTPSIMDSLRDILTVDRVTRVVCVPYFLSPGRHATEDVPELIAEAKAKLVEEGLLADILVSNALGTHLESMMGAVDNLVESVLSEREEGFF